MNSIEVTLRAFIPAEAVAVNYPSNYITNGNDRTFSTAEDADSKVVQSALLSFGAGGEPLPDQSIAEPNRTGKTELFSASDGFPSSVQSGIYTWRLDLKDGAIPVQTTQLDPSTFAQPSIAAENGGFNVDFSLDAKNPLPPSLLVTIPNPFPPIGLPDVPTPPPLLELDIPPRPSPAF